MPAYPGCEDYEGLERIECTNSMVYKHIVDNTVYPSDAFKEQIIGIVYVYYEIDREGFVDNVRIDKGVHELLDQEALRVIELLPQHEPGTQDGKAVRVRYIVPIMFKITGGKSKKKKKRKKKVRPK